MHEFNHEKCMIWSWKLLTASALRTLLYNTESSWLLQTMNWIKHIVIENYSWIIKYISI